MAFFIFSAACLAMVAANSYAPVADSSYGGAAQAPSYGSGSAYPYYSEESNSHEHKKRFHKLKDLDKTGVYDAEIRYFKHKGDYYAEIECPKKNAPKEYTWILADSDSKIPDGNPIDNTVALAGGVNVRYVAKYGHKKWIGRAIFSDDKVKFRRVGCLQGTYQTIIDIPAIQPSPTH